MRLLGYVAAALLVVSPAGLARAAVQMQDVYATRIYRTQIYVYAGQPQLLETRNASWSANPVLHLVDPAGNQVGVDDDSNGGRDARLWYYPWQTGWYTIVVRNRWPGLPGHTADLYRNGALLAPQIPVGGSLLPTEPWRQGEPYQTFYSIARSREDGGGGAAADSVLYLLSGDTLTDFDDDSGASTSARVRPRGQCTSGCAALLGAYTYSTASEGRIRLIRDGLLAYSAYNDYGCSLFAGIGCDRDYDGLSDQLEMMIGTSIWVQDSDGDRLTDSVELYGRGGVNLPWEGSDPIRRDLFLQINYMVDRSAATPHTHYLGSDATVKARLRDSFARYGNGTRLHIDVAGPIPHFSVITNDGATGLPADTTSFEALKRQYFYADREGLYRWLIAAHFYKSWGNGSSGYAYGGDRMVVTFGGWSSVVGTNDENTGTVLHELGHTLGLSHNGNDDGSGRNSTIHRSVMNYRYQIAGVGSGDNVFRYSTDSSCASPYTSPKAGCATMAYPYNMVCDCTFNEWSRLDFSGNGVIAAGLLEEVVSGQLDAQGRRGLGRHVPPVGVGGRILAASTQALLEQGAREGKEADDAAYRALRLVENDALAEQHLRRRGRQLADRVERELRARGHEPGRDFVMGADGPEWLERDVPQ